MSEVQYGYLASEWCGMKLPLQVLQSGAGWYIGTFDLQEGPVSRESEEYWRTEQEAQAAFESGNWTQKAYP